MSTNTFAQGHPNIGGGHPKCSIERDKAELSKAIAALTGERNE